MSRYIDADIILKEIQKNEVNANEIKDIIIGKCYIYPKIDGTNSSIWLDEGVLKAGSRNRELTIENDNAGFYKFVLDNKDIFMPYFNKYPNRRLFGEWLVPHTLKTYDKKAWRNFYIFDVAVDSKNTEIEYLPYNVYKNSLDEFNLEYICPQKIINNPTSEQLQWELEQNHYLMSNETDIGEGIVLKNYDYINQFGVQKWGKIVRSEFREKH